MGLTALAFCRHSCHIL